MRTTDQPRILLVQPPFYRLFGERYSADRYPLALGYLAGAICKGTDWRVLVYNADFSPCGRAPSKVSQMASVGFDKYLRNLKDPSGPVWAEIRATIAEFRPDVVGITATSQAFASAKILARIVKQLDEKTLVVMGGPYPSMARAALLDHVEIDIGVNGEGELTIVELLRAIQSGRSFDEVTGIVYRAGGRAVEQPARELIRDLDTLCFPHETAPAVLKDYDHYPKKAFKNLFATRGCVHNCLFCGSREVWGRKVRFRSPQSVVDEIKALERIGLRRVNFDDDIFGVNRKYINELCDALRRHCPTIRWSCELHVDLVDDQTVSCMKAAGCDSIAIGIESGSNEILSAMRKGITIEEASAACDVVKRSGVELRTFFIIGFPQETEATLARTVDAMKNSGDELCYSIFTPYPYTEAFELCREMGLVDDDFDIALYNHQSPANSFCVNIPPQRFRTLARKIERMVDRKNSLNKLKNRVRRVLSIARLTRQAPRQAEPRRRRRMAG